MIKAFQVKFPNGQGIYNKLITIISKISPIPNPIHAATAQACAFWGALFLLIPHSIQPTIGSKKDNIFNPAFEESASAFAFGVWSIFFMSPDRLAPH